MTFRTKLLLVSSLVVSGAVALVTGTVAVATRRAFERMDEERRNAMIAQFRRELVSRGEQVSRKAQRVAESEEVVRISIEAGKSQPDFAPFLNEAHTQAEAQSLDFLDLVRQDGVIISSSHWPARFGYKNDWLNPNETWNTSESFLARIPLQEGSAVALAGVRATTAGDPKIFALAAVRLNRAFLESLGLAPGMRAILWLSESDVIDARGPIVEPEKLLPLVNRVRQANQQAEGIMEWRGDRSSAEALHALPLSRGNSLLGVLIIGTSLAEQIRLEQWILWTGVLVGGCGILLGVLIGWWTTERITRPVEQLVSGVRAVAGGDWNTRVAVESRDEIGELAAAFNQMTQQLIEHRDRALQAERVAAWRELARRLAHELKNPLFPLQITVENLQRAREGQPSEFDEVFRESTATLLAELSNLKTIIGRFSDFAKMPPPHFEQIELNGIVRDALKLFEAQLEAAGRPRIEHLLHLSASPLAIEADPEQLGRGLRNLVLNAMDAMPEGGTLRLHTEAIEGGVRIRISDTGQGLTAEECSRLFTPYYTTKRHGTGLGLAIAQSVVSDHNGRISVSSEPGKGTTFTIDLPVRRTG